MIFVQPIQHLNSVMGKPGETTKKHGKASTWVTLWNFEKLKKAGVQGPPRSRWGAGFKIKYAQTYLRRRRALPLSGKRSLTSGHRLLQWIPRYITNLTRIFSYFKKFFEVPIFKKRIFRLGSFSKNEIPSPRRKSVTHASMGLSGFCDTILTRNWKVYLESTEFPVDLGGCAVDLCIVHVPLQYSICVAQFKPACVDYRDRGDCCITCIQAHTPYACAHARTHTHTHAHVTSVTAQKAAKSPTFKSNDCITIFQKQQKKLPSSQSLC